MLVLVLASGRDACALRRSPRRRTGTETITHTRTRRTAGGTWIEPCFRYQAHTSVNPALARAHNTTAPRNVMTGQRRAGTGRVGKNRNAERFVIGLYILYMYRYMNV